MTTAFDPLQLGAVQLSNRIAMSPMTRSRAYGPGATVTDLTATYYAQRASAGLIITEGIQPLGSAALTALIYLVSLGSIKA